MLSVLQNEAFDCGLASIRTLLANIHRCSSYLYIKSEKNSGPYSYLDLVKIADNYGVILKGYRFIDFEEFKINKGKFQAIVTLKIDNQKHAIVVNKITNKRIFVFDPNEGETQYSYKDFLEKWDKTALVVISVNRKIKREKTFSFVNKNELIFTGTLGVFSSLFLVMGTFFLSDNQWYVLPIVAFTLAFIFDLIFRSFSFRILANIDRKSEKNTSVRPDKFKIYMERLENYKKSLFEILLTSSSSFILLLFVVALFIFNDLDNFYLLLIVIITVGFKVLFLDKKEELAKQKISNQERKINELKTIEEKFSMYDYVHTLAYRFGYLKYFEKLFSSFVILLAIVILLLAKESFSFPSIIFYFFFLEAFQKSLENLLFLPKSINDYRSKKASLLDVIEIKSENN